MASLNGSSPSPPRPHSSAARIFFGLIFWKLASLAALAELPGYLRTALHAFSPGVPAGWACTLTTIRNDYTLVERFDPSLPPGAQWTLLQCQGRTPTAVEVEKYRKSRPLGSPVGPQANFQKSDIDPGSLTLVWEEADRAEFKGSFREESTGPDKMLGHLVVHLTVNKHHPHVEKYSLSLPTPYNPVLGVKMNELRVETAYAPPGSDHPALPVSHSSRFSGRIFLIATAENLQVTFSDFAHVP